MTDDLTALRDLAEKATPGPWHFHQDDGTALDISEVCIPRPEEANEAVIRLRNRVQQNNRKDWDDEFTDD